MQRRRAVGRDGPGRRVLAVLLWNDGVGRTIVVAHVVGRLHARPPPLSGGLTGCCVIGDGDGGRGRLGLGVGRSLLWRRGVIDNNDLLWQAVLVKFAPIRLLSPTTGLAGWDRAVGVLVGRHGGRRGRRGGLGGLGIGEAGSGRVGSVCVRVG